MIQNVPAVKEMFYLCSFFFLAYLIDLVLFLIIIRFFFQITVCVCKPLKMVH